MASSEAAVRIALVCPAPRGSRQGNRVTAVRWQRLLAALGHRVSVTEGLPRGAFDVLVALHARKSAGAVRTCRERWPERPIVVVLTGTDLYRDLGADLDAQRSVAVADRLVVLHPGAAADLPESVRSKVVFVPQSAPRFARPAAPRSGPFDVAVVGHLRSEKDPFRTALAARLLPPDSRLRVLHAGAALTPEMGERAREEERDNPRYRWLGELTPARARALIARSRLLALTSAMEGGANVISEAAAAGIPIVSSRIACTESLLGADYPGLFPFGDTSALAALLGRAEKDPAWLRDLGRRSRALRASLSPARERAAWKEVLRPLARRPPPR
jgi:putative glycosyltransferase (TIGR04348 family)